MERNRVQLSVERLETRDVPTSAQATLLLKREVLAFQQAFLLNAQASRDYASAQGFLSNGLGAIQELNAAKNLLGTATLLELARFKIGAVTRTVARRDLTIFSQAISTVNNNIAFVQHFYTGVGGSIGGVPLTMMPNFFAGANMLP
jgi:hypothetical protein